MTPTYLIYDPQHDYAIALIEHVYARYGLRPICLYSSMRAEMYARAQYPQLRTAMVLASYFTEQWSPAELAKTLADNYTILGVMPFFEPAISPMAELLLHLPVRWVAPEVLQRFRDKHALKEHVRRQRPDLGLSATRLVRHARDVMAAPRPAEYILKPNDGMGNRRIGFFRADDTYANVDAYFANAPADAAYVLEERLHGPEYCINGQMDHMGRSVVLSIMRYEHRSINGKPNVYHRTHHVRQTAPEFAGLQAYANNVMQATGLSRCPFHMEVIVTANGPQLVEVAARLGGSHMAQAANRVHGEGFDMFAIAAHYYLFNTPYTGSMGNWPHYNAVHLMHVDGIAERTERIYSVDGIEAVQALPEFCGWVVPPTVGKLMQPTLDVFTIPYALQIMSHGGDGSALVQVADRIDAMLQLNRRVSQTRRLNTRLSHGLDAVSQRGRWLLRSL